MVTISSWGRLGSWDHEVLQLSEALAVASQLRSDKTGLAYGMGRSYGDVCINPGGRLWMTSGLDHLISFDQENGRLVCEAGVTLQSIQQLFIPRGWALPVTPGTQFVTVGGAIANDVHGKNHHAVGSFGDHVRSIKLLRTDGSIIACGPDLLQDWFSSTVGGIGLTGIIIEAQIQLHRINGPWMDTEIVPFYGLNDFFVLSDHSEKNWEYAVSWIDCFSKRNVRGIFIRGNHVQKEVTHSTPLKNWAMPFVPPISMVNLLTIRPFNFMYFYANKYKAGSNRTHLAPFFYPLDNIRHWNRMYGPKGFYQFQCVLPVAERFEATQSLLNEINSSGQGSFLSVLKTFGNRRSVGLMGFPMPGVTLAMDFPNEGNATLNLLGKLENIVRDAGGRIYMAKDATMSRDSFEAGYPMLNDFLRYRDPGISSSMSRRLIGY